MSAPFILALFLAAQMVVLFSPQSLADERRARDEAEIDYQMQCNFIFARFLYARNLILAHSDKAVVYRPDPSVRIDNLRELKVQNEIVRFIDSTKNDGYVFYYLTPNIDVSPADEFLKRLGVRYVPVPQAQVEISCHNYIARIFMRENSIYLMEIYSG